MCLKFCVAKKQNKKKKIILYSLLVFFFWQVFSIWWAFQTPPLPLRSETVPVHRLREEVRPQRSPVETPQSPPLSTKQQDGTLCKRTPLTLFWLSDAKRRRGGGLFVTKDKRIRGGDSPNTLKKDCKGLFITCVFMFKCVTHVSGTVIIYWVRKRL